MPGELQYLNLTDFTGGLNMYRNQFQLAGNESPDMLNVGLDPRAGFFVREGVTRMNGADIHGTDWNPRSARTLVLNDGLSASYIAANSTIYTSGDGGASWSDMGVVCSASPHLADFAAWADKAYISCGPDNQSACQAGNWTAGSNEAVLLLNAEGLNFDNDYTIKSEGVMPQCEVTEPHSGYLFCGNTSELGVPYPNRLRWSHPLRPESYAENDYIDIDIGGGEITALMSFQDHLLIFKTDSMWALYGYDTDSWQLIKVSRDIGVQHPGAATRSESAVFFHSASDRGDIWAYSGGGSPTAISEPLRPVMDGIVRPEDVWVSWVARHLVISVPWNDDPQVESDRSVFLWDPDVGGGAWTRNSIAEGEVRCILERGDHIAGGDAVMVVASADGASAGFSCIVKSNGSFQALDFVTENSPGVPFETRYRTGWKYDSSPERRKSWRRPRFVLPAPTVDADILVSTFQDYEEGSARRSHKLLVRTDGSVLWTLTGDPADQGFRYGDGTVWDRGSASGSQIRRAQPPGPGLSGLGVCAAVQLEFKITKENSTGARWGLDAAILKHRSRRGTT